jgi:hypothetical protein
VDPEEMSDAEIEARIDAINAYLGQFTTEVRALHDEVQRRRATTARRRLRLLPGGGEVAAFVSAPALALLRHRPRHPLAAAAAVVTAGTLAAMAFIPAHVAPSSPMPAALPPTIGLPDISATTAIPTPSPTSSSTQTTTMPRPISTATAPGATTTLPTLYVTTPAANSTPGSSTTVTSTSTTQPTPPSTTAVPSPSCLIEATVTGVLDICIR